MLHALPWNKVKVLNKAKLSDWFRCAVSSVWLGASFAEKNTRKAFIIRLKWSLALMCNITHGHFRLHWCIKG